MLPVVAIVGFVDLVVAIVLSTDQVIGSFGRMLGLSGYSVALGIKHQLLVELLGLFDYPSAVVEFGPDLLIDLVVVETVVKFTRLVSHLSAHTSFCLQACSCLLNIVLLFIFWGFLYLSFFSNIKSLKSFYRSS